VGGGRKTNDINEYFLVIKNERKKKQDNKQE
jgi:hypothetical protein